MGHLITDKDAHFIINAITRQMKCENAKKIKVMQYDHKSERLTFICPRYIEGHDMSLCTDVKVHFNNVDAKTKQENKDADELTDLQVNPDDDQTVICSWLISSNATQLIGFLHFIVRYSCDDYAWGTDIATLTVSESIDSGDFVVEEYADILAQWKAELYNAGYINASAMQSEIETMKARMNTFAKLKDGSTTGDAELADIRVGADGVTYGSAGTAVREQLKNIYTESRSANRFNQNDPSNIVGYYVRSDGSLVEDANYVVSHFIPAKANDVIRVTEGVETGYYGGCLYDSAKNAIGTRVQIVDGMYAIIDENCCYIKLNVLKNVADSVMACVNSEIPSEYEKYFLARTLHDSINFNEVQMAFLNPLYGKVVSFNGDSICYGEGCPGGYGLMIANENNMIYENRGVSGAMIKAETYFDDEKTNPRHWICRDIENMRSDAEYIILEGGVNDDSTDNLGAITSGFRAELDDTTFCGAFESMLKKAILKWHGKKIGFILSPKAYNYDGMGADKEKWDMARAICEKWSIPYLDLRNASGLNAGLSETKAMFFHNADGVHPNELGYKVIVPKIVAWMKTL